MKIVNCLNDKINKLSEKNRLKIFLNYEFKDEFLQIVDKLESTDIISCCSLANAILDIQSNGELQMNNCKESKGEPFKHEPLIGFHKVHFECNSQEAMLQNAGLRSKQSPYIFEKINGEEIQIKFKDENKTLKEYSEFSKEYCKNKSKKECTEAFGEFRSKPPIGRLKNKVEQQKSTGYWLIYSKINDQNIYLYTYLGNSHGEEASEVIYSKMKELYSECFLDDLKIKSKPNKSD